MRSARMISLCLGIVAVAALPGCSLLTRTDEPDEVSPIRIQEPTPQQLQKLDHARDQVEAGHYDEALTIFQSILAENPTIAPAYLGIGDIYVLKKNYGKAEPVFRRAARLEPRNFDAQYGHGLALQMLQRFVEAVSAYVRALSIEPESHRANLNLATVYLHLDSPRQALVFAEKAVAGDPASGPAHVNLGAIYETVGRYSDAINEYISALELMGNDPRLMMNLINVHVKEKRYREAANTAETLLRIDATAQAHERLGWCFFKLRDYDASMAAYREAVEMDAYHWPALNGIGVNALNTWLLSEKRDKVAKREASDAFRRSLRVNANQQKVIQLMLNYDL